jgi:DNA-binding PadR family transcriptional regulator
MDMFDDYWGSRGRRREAFWDAARRGGAPWGRGPWSGRRGGPPDWFGDLFGAPPRADRGGVRYLVLDAIAQQARHGYEIIQAIEERSGGSYRPSPGVVYPTLQLLEELGHARAVEQDARKVYTITDQGRADLELHREEVAEFYERSTEQGWEQQLEDFGDLMRRGVHLLKSFKRAAHRGHLSPRTQARLREVLDDAIRRVEEILAEGRRER